MTNEMLDQVNAAEEVYGMADDLMDMINNYITDGDMTFSPDEKINRYVRTMMAKRAISILSVSFAAPIQSITVNFLSDRKLQ